MIFAEQEIGVPGKVHLGDHNSHFSVPIGCGREGGTWSVSVAPTELPGICGIIIPGVPRTFGPGSPQAIDNRAFGPPNFPCSSRLDGCTGSNFESLTSQLPMAGIFQ